MTSEVVLIGRNNVGKSTLFNKMTNSNSALVGNEKKLTRDRLSFYLKIKEKKILLTDTAGITFKTNEFEKKVLEQTYFAIKNANLILFIVNAKESISSEDHFINEILRKTSKKILLVVNKIDLMNEKFEINNFFELGYKEKFIISASRGTGIQNLIEKGIIPNIKDKKNKKKYNNEKNPKKIIKVTFVGAPNVGKSTLINKIINKKRVITSNISGTTRDSINIPLKKNNKNYILIDTAGIKRKNKILEKIQLFSIKKTLENINQTDITLFIIDISKLKIYKEDLNVAKKIIEAKKPIIVVFNKCDLLNKKKLKNFSIDISKKLNFLYYCQFQFISALKNQGIKKLLNNINVTYHSSLKKNNSSKLTIILKEAIKKHQPPNIQGKKIKLKYAHPGGYKPTIIIIHGNRTKYLPKTYKKYLANYFQNTLNLIGSPINIFFKENKNPFS
ncbi:ribosome biogenesis GTPase Der [Buchnera aphidicola]|uniref:ribosome biogenesis GTPase Der n=1 Tax=Buchnera aphidicola TaxID=9 RepID=UPI0031B8A7FC